VKTEVYKLCC